MPDELVQARVDKACCHYRNRKISYEIADEMMITVERGSFDAFLLEKALDAGARFQRFDAKNAKETKEKVRISDGDKTISADFAVAADGIPSTVGRQLGFRIEPVDQLIAFEGHVDSEDLEGFRKDRIDIFFFDDLRGYGWVFPRRDGYSIGLGSVLSEGSMDRYLGFLKDMGLKKKPPVKAHLVPMGKKDVKASSERTLLCGDAAGFGEPLTGEGIYYAVRSGKHAAKAIAEGEPTEYDLVCAKYFSEDFRRARKAFKYLFKTRPYSLYALMSNPQMLEEFSKVQTGKQDYKKFKDTVLKMSPKILWNTIKSH